MPAQIQSNDSIIKSELLQLILPLLGVSAKSMHKNKRPLGVLGRDVDCRKPYQRICRNADFMTIEIEVNVHNEGSLQRSLKEDGRVVRETSDSRAQQVMKWDPGYVDCKGHAAFVILKPGSLVA